MFVACSKGAGRFQSDNGNGRLDTSAETAGFFATRGARTHLIMPTVVKGARTPEIPEDDKTPPADLDDGGGGNGNGRGGNGAQPTAMDELRREYVAMLMDLLRVKAQAGESDPDLMERIEKLLSLNT